MKKKPTNRLAVLLILTMVLCQGKVHAVENTAASTEDTEAPTGNTLIPTENITVPVKSHEIISVVLPVVEERDPFSFFIDPLQIFYNTFGNSGGDVTVEEDTYLLFYNHNERGYTLSSQSDRLTITNKSTVPVEVTITAKIENVDGITVMQEEAFEDRDSCDLYLALVDSDGNEQPLSEDGEVSVTVELDRAPLDAYAYMLDEDTGEYQYACRLADAAFDTYSFGLKGACNEKGDWTGISGNPHVTISWNVEHVVSEGAEAEEETKETSESVSGNSISEDSASDEPAAPGGKITTGSAAVDREDSVSENSVPDSSRRAGSLPDSDSSAAGQ